MRYYPRHRAPYVYEIDRMRWEVDVMNWFRFTPRHRAEVSS